jgi:hypothetical protein
LLRIILLIPQFIVVFILGIAAFFVLVAAWFAALVTGQVPAALRGFLEFFIRWVMRVECSIWLLTDVYPPFSDGDLPTFPITMAFPEEVPLNRVAVLFRLVLVFPAAAIEVLLQAGLGVLAFPYWIAALILGRLPVPVFRMLATYVRYTVRVHAYFSLITPCYPWGWKGDVGEHVAASPIPPAPSNPEVEDTTIATPEVSASTGLPSYPTPTSSIEPGEPGDFDFVLTGWSQAWVWITLAIGVLSELRNNSGGVRYHH